MAKLSHYKKKNVYISVHKSVIKFILISWSVYERSPLKVN